MPGKIVSVNEKDQEVFYEDESGNINTDKSKLPGKPLDAMYRKLIGKEQGSTRMEIFRASVDEGCALENAVHSTQDECGFVIKGECTFTTPEGETHFIGPGTAFLIPAGSIMDFKCTKGPLEIVATMSPLVS